MTVATGDSFTYDGPAHRRVGRGQRGAGTVTGSAVLTYTGDQVNAGTYTVTATYAGDANHPAARTRPTITIDKATSTTSPPAAASPTTARPHRRLGQRRGGGIVTGSAVLIYSGDQVNAGTYTVTATYAGDANHPAAPTRATITIDKARPRRSPPAAASPTTARPTPAARPSSPGPAPSPARPC